MPRRVERHVTVILALTAAGSIASCTVAPRGPQAVEVPDVPTDHPYLVVLGVGQDGGYPQAGTPPGEAWAPERRRRASSLAVVDPVSGERWLFEATPDFREQLHDLDALAPRDGAPGLDGIFLTHAHVGHYTGLIHLGREIIGAAGTPVYALPRMHRFLSANGPWDQLVELGNIELRHARDDEPVRLNERLTVTPFLVPHRDEYSETVGFRIEGPRRSVVFLPDIDKWERWDALGTRIEDVVRAADVAYLDATFYADGEVPGRAMSEIPHPFVTETMRRFEAVDAGERAKIRFIHINRTNPIGDPQSPESGAVLRAGFGIAERLEIVGL
jgi:pyrroloquinoline quinone biosynthesis protein B